MFRSCRATGKVGEYSIDQAGISVAQALARGGGTTDTQADRLGLFLFRYEDSDFVSKLQVPAAEPRGGKVPVIYAFDLGTAPGYFLSTKFAMQPNDVVFVSDARLVQWQKMLSLFGTITAPAATSQTLAR